LIAAKPGLYLCAAAALVLPIAWGRAWWRRGSRRVLAGLGAGALGLDQRAAEVDAGGVEAEAAEEGAGHVAGLGARAIAAEAEGVAVPHRVGDERAEEGSATRAPEIEGPVGDGEGEIARGGLLGERGAEGRERAREGRGAERGGEIAEREPQAFGEARRVKELLDPARREARGPALGGAPREARREAVVPALARGAQHRLAAAEEIARERRQRGGFLAGYFERVEVDGQAARGLGAALGLDARGVGDGACAAREGVGEDAAQPAIRLGEHPPPQLVR